jgi:hypothetical protein
VRDAFFPVLVAVVAIAVVIGFWALSGMGDELRRTGRGGLSLHDGADRSDAVEQAHGGAVREEEIRQMLAARNARRVARGLPEVDIERELARLDAAEPPSGGSASTKAREALEAEVRQLVTASNARRVRMGRQPLDIEAEVARRLRDS